MAGEFSQHEIYIKSPTTALKNNTLTLFFSDLAAWLLEELSLDYEIQFADRMSNMKAPEDFKASSGHPLGKLPSLKDGDHTIYESGVITEYVQPWPLCKLRRLTEFVQIPVRAIRQQEQTFTQRDRPAYQSTAMDSRC